MDTMDATVDVLKLLSGTKNIHKKLLNHKLFSNSQQPLRSFHTIRLILYDSNPGVRYRVNTCI